MRLPRGPGPPRAVGQHLPGRQQHAADPLAGVGRLGVPPPELGAEGPPSVHLGGLRHLRELEPAVAARVLVRVGLEALVRSAEDPRVAGQQAKGAADVRARHVVPAAAGGGSGGGTQEMWHANESRGGRRMYLHTVSFSFLTRP